LLSFRVMTLFETIKPLSPEGILFKSFNTTKATTPTITIETIIETTIVNVKGSVFIVMPVSSCSALLRLNVLPLIVVLLFFINFMKFGLKRANNARS